MKPNAYRGILSTARRVPNVHFGIELAPDELNLAGMRLAVSVLDAKGRKVGESTRAIDGNTELSFRIPVALSNTLPEGDYKIKALLSNGSQKVAESESPLKIIAPREAQTIVDEDNTLLVNGKPFFPIGIYHVTPEEYSAIADLGMNTVQYWIWQQFSNVFAIDPYGTTQKVHDWTTKAVKAVNHRKAVICVPGTFGKETPAQLRSSAYVALANDVRGIVWYPWSQVGGGPVGIGLKNSPEQQAVIKEICGEIKALTPALTAPFRVPFQSEDDKLQGILCSDAAVGNYLLLVNVTDEPIESEIVVPHETGKLNGRFEDFFNKDKEPLSVRENRFKIKLDPYETRVFHAK